MDGECIKREKAKEREREKQTTRVGTKVGKHLVPREKGTGRGPRTINKTPRLTHANVAGGKTTIHETADTKTKHATFVEKSDMSKPCGDRRRPLATTLPPRRQQRQERQQGSKTMQHQTRGGPARNAVNTMPTEN